MMRWIKQRALAKRCQQYLQEGPPAHMHDYMPESLTELIIAHGAQCQPLGEELRELGDIVLEESASLETIEDPEIRDYLLQGAALVKDVLNHH